MTRNTTISSKASILLVTVASICLLSVASWISAVSASPNSNLNLNKEEFSPVTKTLLDGMKNREDSIHTVEAYWVKEVYNNVEGYPGFGKGANPLQFSHLFWVAKRDKVREDEDIIIPDDLGYHLYSFDGQKTTSWDYGAPKAAVFYGQEALDVLSSQGTFAFQIPLGGSADNANLNISNQIAKRKLQSVHIEQLNNIQTYLITAMPSPEYPYYDKWWVAPEYGYLVLRHETISPNMSKDGKHPLWKHVDIVDKLKKVGDVWVPAINRYIVYAYSQESKDDIWVSLYRSTLTDVSLNLSLPDAMFDLPLPLGTQIISRDHGSSFVGGNIGTLLKRAQQSNPSPALLSDSVLSLQQ